MVVFKLNDSATAIVCPASPSRAYIKWVTATRGSGNALMAWLCEWADERGITLSLSPADDSDALPRWYAHFGFEDIGMGFMTRLARTK